MHNDTIVGIASGMGGGIGIVRISGEKCLEIIGRIYRNKKYVDNFLIDNNIENKNEWDVNYFEKKDTHTIHYGYIVDDNRIVDEVLIMLMKGPNSYTREDVVEIDCHGGPFVVQKILQTVIKNGARLSEPGEFTKRAFLNGRIDLSQAEAVMKVISSQSDFALGSAIKQLEGNVSKYIEEIRQEILHNLGYIEAALDDPEHYDLDGYSEELKKIINSEINNLQKVVEKFNDGRMKSEGINTVIVGKPNAGKSSLMNLLLDEERAIVTDIAGTTRDILEEKVRIGDIVLNLVDTAGIHDTNDVVESMGVSKAVGYVDSADFIIYVVDSSVQLDEADDRIIDMLQSRTGVILMNKSDLDTKISKKEIRQRLDWDCIDFSNETGFGLEELGDYITNSFLDGSVTYNDQVYLTSMRHKEAVENAIVSLKNVVTSIDDGMPEDFYTIDMMDAYKKLGLINGETASEDLVNKIFKDFCMGK